MGKRFNEYIERKISTGTLYQHTLAGMIFAVVVYIAELGKTFAQSLIKRLKKELTAGGITEQM